MTNQTEPPIYCGCSVRDSFWSTGWSDKRVFCMKCNKEIRPAQREIPTPDPDVAAVADRFIAEARLSAYGPGDWSNELEGDFGSWAEWRQHFIKHASSLRSSPDSLIAAFEHLASGLYRWDAETKTLIGEGFAKPESVPCDTCGNPVPDRGAAKSWCSDACYGKSGEALVEKLGEYRKEACNCGDEGYCVPHAYIDGCIEIVQQHYTNSPVCKDSEGQCIQTDHVQREISLKEGVKAPLGSIPSLGSVPKRKDEAGSIPVPPATTPEPVSVSLEKCARAIGDKAGTPDDEWTGWQPHAKAVLDAAGVKYVD